MLACYVAKHGHANIDMT